MFKFNKIVATDDMSLVSWMKKQGFILWKTDVFHNIKERFGLFYIGMTKYPILRYNFKNFISNLKLDIKLYNFFCKKTKLKSS